MKVRQSVIVFAVFFVAIAFRFLSESTANISFFILAIAACFGKKEAIQALALTWLFTMLSPGISPAATLGAVGRYVVIFVAAMSVLLRYRPNQYQSGQKRILLLTMALGVFFILHSIFFSAVPDVSILKAFSWTLTVVTLFTAWGGLSEKNGDHLVRQLFAGLTLLALLSLPLISLPLGYLRNGHGFQGVLNHPQTFGPAVALLGVWVFLGMLKQPRASWGTVVLTSICIVLILMSEARTAGFAMVGGIISAMIGAIFLLREPVAKLFPGMRSKRVGFVALIAVSVGIAFAPTITDVLNTYVSKRNDVDSVVAAYDKSRGGLIGGMLHNIHKKPVVGIGFGIATNPKEMLVTRDPVFGLPVGAAIEKGVLPIAVVEEVGVVGLLVVVLWGWGILRAALRHGGAAVGLLGAIILLNFGEYTLFSVGGFGMLSLVLLGWIATGENKDRRIARA